jgi:DNA-binding MarR family transcriptional regulator
VNLEQAIQTKGFKSERHKAVVNLLFTAYHVKTHLSQVLKNYALTHEQYNVLRILKGSHPNPRCVRDIASRMIERNSNVPRIVDRLEIKKLVKRTVSPEDRRETLIQVSTAGLNLLDACSEALEKEQNNFVSLTEEQAANLNSLLESMVQE